jgi:hypothetical protein
VCGGAMCWCVDGVDWCWRCRWVMCWRVDVGDADVLTWQWIDAILLHWSVDVLMCWRCWWC